MLIGLLQETQKTLFRESDVFSPTVVNNDAADQYVWIEVVEASFSCGTGESIEFHFDAINGKIPFPASFLKKTCCSGMHAYYQS